MCRPEGITIREGHAFVSLQNMFEHTYRRIFEIPGSDLSVQLFRFRDENGGTIEVDFVVGVGPDGSIGELIVHKL